MMQDMLGEINQEFTKVKENGIIMNERYWPGQRELKHKEPNQ